MNSTVYLFGEFNSGYSQYPDDYTSKIFKIFYENAKSVTQIVIHREGNLMYYGYIRKLENNRYIGLCVVLNGLMLTRIDGLFSLFENTITGLVANGRLIHFNEQGDIVTRVEKLYMDKEGLDLISESLRAGFNSFYSDLVPLPAVSFSVSKDSVKDFVFDDNNLKIIESSHTNGYTFIYKSKGYDTALMNSYKGVITRMSNENKELRNKLEQLQIKYSDVLRQKKQFKIVIVLFGVLLACSFTLFSLNKDLTIASNALSSANDTINIQNGILNSQSKHIGDLQCNNNELAQKFNNEETRRIKSEEELERLREAVGKQKPFIVENTSFNFESGYLKFDYYGMTSTNVTVQVHVSNDDGFSLSSASKVLYIEPGNHSASLFVSRNLKENDWYTFMIMNGTTVLGGGSH